MLYVVADNLTKDLVGVNMAKGLDPGTFRELVSRMVQERAAIQNVYEVVGAVEFEYTFWAKPDNESAVRQNLIDVCVHIMSLYRCNALIASCMLYLLPASLQLVLCSESLLDNLLSKYGMWPLARMSE